MKDNSGKANFTKPKIVKLIQRNQTNRGKHYLCTKCGGILSWGNDVVSRISSNRKYYHIICAKELGLIDS